MNRLLRTTAVTALAGGLAICLVLQLAFIIQRWGPSGALPDGWTVLALHLGGRRHPVLPGLLPGLPAAAWTALELAVVVTDRTGVLLQLALLTFAPVLFVTMLLTVAAPIAALATNWTQPAPRGWLAAHGLAAAALPLAMSAACVAMVWLAP